ncbi:MAG: hypothetical protein H6671_06220 [Anaerolineaceae bacterium]|nr:hypothetical protein [Anaerolineaceae bacterium]
MTENPTPETPEDDLALIAQIKAARRAEPELAVTESTPLPPPWLLQQFYQNEIDLGAELATRFPDSLLLSVGRFRSVGAKTQIGVAKLATPDNMATLLIETDATTHAVQFTFAYSSVYALRFRMDTLSDLDRARWLDLMRRPQGGLAFLWSQSRWADDYIICAVRNGFAHLYAFSRFGYEAAIRLAPDVTKNLLDWLEAYWKPVQPKKSSSEKPPQLDW